MPEHGDHALEAEGAGDIGQGNGQQHFVETSGHREEGDHTAGQ